VLCMFGRIERKETVRKNVLLRVFHSYSVWRSGKNSARPSNFLPRAQHGALNFSCPSLARLCKCSVMLMKFSLFAKNSIIIIKVAYRNLIFTNFSPPHRNAM
jgi:hypothetical protein